MVCGGSLHTPKAPESASLQAALLSPVLCTALQLSSHPTTAVSFVPLTRTGSLQYPFMFLSTVLGPEYQGNNTKRQAVWSCARGPEGEQPLDWRGQEEFLGNLLKKSLAGKCLRDGHRIWILFSSKKYLRNHSDLGHMASYE